MKMNKQHAMIAASIAVAAGAGFGAARWSADAPAAAEHVDAEGAGHEGEEKEGEEHAGEKGGGDDFVALPARAASAAGVDVATVGKGGGSELILPGRVVFAPHAEAAVAAPLSGVVETVHVAMGSRVGAGAPIATVRSPEGAALRASAQATAADADAARAAFRREDRLLKAGVVARQDWEAARATALKADAQLRAARAQLSALGAPGSAGRMTIRSPIAGTITNVGTATGGFVAQGAAIAQVANQDRVELIFDAPAAASRAIRPGTPIYATDATGQEITAVVTTVSPNVASAGAQVRARATGFVPPAGTPVSGRALAGNAATLSVPTDAVQTVEGGSVVFVLENGGFRARPVVPGRVAVGRTEIIRGLAEGEKVAGRGAFLLKAELSKSEAEHAH